MAPTLGGPSVSDEFKASTVSPTRLMDRIKQMRASDVQTSNNLNPDVPTLLPELSDGPHLAYSVQWILFAGMVLFGLYLVIREERRPQAEKA